MNDLTSLLQLVSTLSGQIQKASNLIVQMREEGREHLHEDEKQELRARDDTARSVLLQASEERESGEG